MTYLLFANSELWVMTSNEEVIGAEIKANPEIDKWELFKAEKIELKIDKRKNIKSVEFKRSPK